MTSSAVATRKDPEQTATASTAGVAVEIATLRAIALEQPRNEELIAKKALSELDIFPEFAEKAFYSIPYKQKQDDGSYKTVYVEGNSIKAAMSLVRKWGNCLSLGRIIGQDEERILVGGIFYDAETNVFAVRSLPVSRVYIDKRNGTVIPLREDRLKKSIAAEMSKSIRNAILASLPEALTEAYFHKAKAIVSGLKGKNKKEKKKAYKDRCAAMFKKFEALKIDPKFVAEFMIRDEEFLALQTDEERIARMIGIYNAIKDGAAQAEEFFGPYMSKGEKKEKNSTDVSLEDLPGLKDGKS